MSAQGSPKTGRASASPRKSPRATAADDTKSGDVTSTNKSPRTKSPRAPEDNKPQGDSGTPRKDGGGKTKTPSAGKSGRKSKTKDRSKSPPKSAGSKAGRRASSQAETGGNKVGSATLRRVTLRSASIHERGLKTVDMCGQGMTVLQASLFQKKDVGILDLSSNNLRSIPPDIKKLQTLVHLDISRNGIRCAHNADFGGLPAELGLLQSLEILIISECNLPFIPPAIWKCKKLKVLDISRNKINLLPPDIGQLEALEHLNAQQTNISTLPAEIAYCQSLEDIYLWGNVIDSLPDTMREMGALKTLAINNRSFTQIVDNYMDNLLRKGQIQSEHIPPVLFEIPSLNILDLEETKINCLPERCACRLKEFYLAKNYFQSIQPMILQLDGLDTLDLSNNLITDLPENIGDLSNLTVLRINNNAFVQVPDSIGDLSKLEELGMGGNRIQVLPDTIGKLSALKVLLLEKNELVTIPETMVHLQQLEILDLTSNQIHALPTNFYQMKKLSTAHCYKNFHKHGLWLHLNPLVVPPETVWKTTDPKGIYLYLKKLQIKRTENLQRQKLVILGEAQCGKTSLMRTMAAGKSSLTAGSEESTEVVDFFSWTTDNLVQFLVHDMGGDGVYKTTAPLFIDPKALYLVVYDHRKYTHEKHDTAIGRWLELLYMYAPGATVKIVGTQCDQCNPDFVEKNKEHVKEALQAQVKRYETRIQEEISKIGEMLKKAEKDGDNRYSVNSLKKQKFRLMMLKRVPLKIQGDVSLVSCGERTEGIQQLITDIELIGVDRELFPHAQRFVPGNWAAFRTALKRQRVRPAAFMTMDETRNLARRHNIVKDGFEDCLRFMKDIGEVLWFESVPALKDMVFQRPKTLVSILRGIFTHRLPQMLNFDDNRIFSSKGAMTQEIFQLARDHLMTNGEISRDMLLCLWFSLKITNDLLEELLDLMPRLDLCYTIPQPEIPPRRSEFFPMMVVPSYNKDPPPTDISAIWPESPTDDLKEVDMTLTFPILYPDGLFERLSCRLQDQLNTRIDWQDLILTEFFSGKMLISRELNPESYDCVIRIRIQGEHVNFLKNTMAFVYRELGNLLANCPGLIWYKMFSVKNCGELEIKDCFPPEVLMSE